MGSTTSKQAPEQSELRRPFLDSGSDPSLSNQKRSINSNAFRDEGIMKWDHFSEKLDSKEDDSNKNLSDLSDHPLTPQMLTGTSCGPKVFHTSPELMDEEDSWKVVDSSDLKHSCLNPNISSSSEFASDDIPPQLNNKTKNEKSPFLSKCHLTLKLISDIVCARVNLFERKIAERRMKLVSPASTNPSVEKKKVVFYFTSLKALPSTYDDCQHTKKILQGYGVHLDERNVFMDDGLKYELNELLGMSFQGKLPRVFVNGCYIGGAEEVRNLHLSGELVYYLQGCEMKEIGKYFKFEPCRGCAGNRFLLCLSCSGSQRVYVETSDDNCIIFRRCNDCNECGLIRCPICW